MPDGQGIAAGQNWPAWQVERITDQAAERQLRQLDPGSVSIAAQPRAGDLVRNRLAHVDHVEVGRVTVRLLLVLAVADQIQQTVRNPILEQGWWIKIPDCVTVPRVTPAMRHQRSAMLALSLAARDGMGQ